MENKLLKEIVGSLSQEPKRTNVSNLILNDKKSFKQHLKKLIEIDKINDRNAKKLYKSKEDLLAWINSKDAFENAYGQIRAYLHIAQKEIPAEQFKKHVEELGKVVKKLKKIDIDEAALIFKHKKQIIGYLNSPLLQKYKRWFTTRYFGEQNHIIDEKETKAIMEIKGTELVDGLFKAIVQRDFIMTQPPSDSQGNIIQSGRIADFFNSDDPQIRYSAWVGYIGCFFTKFNALGELIKIKIFRSWQLAHFREFKTIFDMDMHDFEISSETGEKIFKTCKYFKNEFERFAEYKDRVITIQCGAKIITPWDREKGVGINPVNGISKQETQRDILGALSVFGDEYLDIVKKIFAEKWVDWDYDPEDGETNFSCTFKGNCRYPIKVNFKGNAWDETILAHEIGHSVNAELSKKNNVYEGCNLVLSEIPSFVNEMLMVLYLIFVKYKNNERLEHLNICYATLERLYETISESAILTLTADKLEKELLDKDELFTKQVITIYRETKKEYGAVMPIEEKWQKANGIYGWYDLHHLSTLFKVAGSHQSLQYYLGATIGVCIAIQIFRGTPGVVEKYLNFLKSGRTKDPIAALKTIGFDVTNPNTFKPLVNICKTLMNELERYKPAENARTEQSEPVKEKPKKQPLTNKKSLTK